MPFETKRSVRCKTFMNYIMGQITWCQRVTKDQKIEF